MSCIDCGKLVSTKHTQRCKCCARKGVLNPNYKTIKTFNQKEYLNKWKEGHADYMKVWESEHKGACCDCNKPIDRRSNRCLSCARKAEHNHSWKGGITPLAHWIRNTIENKDWIYKVMVRDGFLCRGCGKKGDIEAHHINHFSSILKDFIGEYNQFSPIDDVETLVRLSVNYKPFWDINNGIALCIDCHQTGVHQWKSLR